MKTPRSRASEHIGLLIRELRAKAGIPRVRLAERADMDVSHLARIESGEGNPTLFVIIQLATALDVKPETFVHGLTAADLPENLKPYSEADFRRELRRRAGEQTGR
ncbi:helix-turn-helix domain-containing protein [Microbacterium tumbae]